MTNVDDTVRERIEAARRRREQKRRQRAELAEARTHGLTARMRSKRRRWDDEEGDDAA